MMKIAFSSFRLPFGSPAPQQQNSQPALSSSAETAPLVLAVPSSGRSSPTTSQAVGIPSRPTSQSGSPSCSPSPSAPIVIPSSGMRRSAPAQLLDSEPVAAEDFRINGAKDFSKVSRGNKREAVALVTNAFSVVRPTVPVTANANFSLTPMQPVVQPAQLAQATQPVQAKCSCLCSCLCGRSELDGPARAPSPDSASKSLLSSSASSTSSVGSDSSRLLSELSESADTSRFRASSAGVELTMPGGGTISMSQLMKEEANEGLRRIKSEANIAPLADGQEPPPPKPKHVNADTFEKIKLIGRGDVGKVYLVRHRETNELYAMKVLDKAQMIRRNKIKRVLTERDILATADHPFIVTLHWSFQSSEKLYLVMDYCAGGGLFRIIQQQPGRCLPEDSVRFYAAEVLLALEYLHMMGFIYRDLKSENVLLHASGHIMLTDFDLSKVAVRHSEAQMLKAARNSKPDIYATPELESNSFVGTAEYLAPEVIRGYHQSCAVDWWTYGILIYEMLYGFTPFQAKNTEDTFAAILEGGLYFPDNHIYPVSADAKSLIRRLLHADPKRRLGGEHDAVDIKKHRFFDKINFVLIRNLTPPLIPKVKRPDDTSYFRNLKDEEPESDTDSELSEEEQMTGPFKDFKQVFKETRVKRTYNKDHQMKPPLGGPQFGHRRVVSMDDVMELTLAKKEKERQLQQKQQQNQPEQRQPQPPPPPSPQATIQQQASKLFSGRPFGF